MSDFGCHLPYFKVFKTKIGHARGANLLWGP